MSEFHKYVKDTYAEVGKEGVEDTYGYRKKCEIFWDEVSKFNEFSTPK